MQMDQLLGGELQFRAILQNRSEIKSKTSGEVIVVILEWAMGGHKLETSINSFDGMSPEQFNAARAELSKLAMGMIYEGRARLGLNYKNQLSYTFVDAKAVDLAALAKTMAGKAA